MIIKRYLYILVVFFTFSPVLSFSQSGKTLSLKEIVSLAAKQSPDAVMAKHRFRGAYWRYKSYKANYLPSLSLSATVPEINRSIDGITLPDGSDKFIERKTASGNMNLSIEQNFALTGGTFFISSNLNRIDLLNDSITTSYMATPFSIGFTQPLLGFNALKWDKKIEPLAYKEARKEYIREMQEISLRAVRYFFDMALAQINLEIAKKNYSNNDTLYKIAEGRYNIGTIAENELLQMELSYLNSRSGLNEAKLNLKIKKFRLESFLGLSANQEFTLLIPYSLPNFEVDFNKALKLATENNPTIINLNRQVLEAERSVAQAKAESRFNANLFMSVGLTQTGDKINAVYKDVKDRQQISVGVQVPILDWGLRKGRYEMARSNMEVIKTNIDRSKLDFEQEVYLKTMQFNSQDEQVYIAAKTDTIGMKRYEVSKQRFYIGKIDISDLNVASQEKDQSRRQYISAIRNYWEYYYTMRMLTLYDFNANLPIAADYESLLE